ncbi:MAG: DUF6516 family protein [Patescibacteria group bacterium]|nr:DUF6516 family protein [Patescibacteria group bacterium]
MGKYQKFSRIAEVEFSDIVVATDDLGHKLRIYLCDKTFIDFYLSAQTKTKRFSLHWERINLPQGFYRLDNTPDPAWKKVSSFPVHFHRGKYEKVVSSPFQATSVNDYFRQFLAFARKEISSIR